MSYENHDCPCGGRKLPETMLCADCVVALEGRREMRVMQDDHEDLELRRSAAIILLTLARKRGGLMTFSTGYGPITVNKAQNL